MMRSVWRAFGIIITIFTFRLLYAVTTFSQDFQLLQNLYGLDEMPSMSIEARKAEWQKYLNLAENKEKRKRLPDVVGIGVKKCGTDAVISFLRYHPFVKTPADVETFFFNHKYKQGLNFYKNLMPAVTEQELIMEKTPAYFDSPPISLPDRIYRSLPNAKLILVVCDPIKRSFSDYTHERARYEISSQANAVARYPTFDSYLDTYLSRVKDRFVDDKKEMLTTHLFNYYSDHASTILSTGFYSLYLARWTALFDSKRLLILNGEELLNDPGPQIEKMQEFLGVPKLLLVTDFVRNPLTGLFCIRPWWRNYDFKAEVQNKPGWHENLSCLSKTKGRTRHRSGSVNATEKHLASLKKLYDPFNRDLFKMTGINYEY